MQITSLIKSKRIAPEHLFMLSVLVVNGGNYLYNLVLGRLLGPKAFADVAVLVTFLLVLSFAAMTFQLVTAKFSIHFEGSLLKRFISKTYKHSFLVGLLFGIAIIGFSSALASMFNTTSSAMYVIFGFGVPVYFIMSVNRGIHQGNKAYKQLSITYQTEMLSRFCVTLLLLFFCKGSPAVAVALGIVVSFMFGLIPFRYKGVSLKNHVLPHVENIAIRKFFVITAFYELTQIVINNSDILLVKHYFDAHSAGLYAALALIGRMVYFLAWMFVMLLLPTVIQLKKEGRQTTMVLYKYIGYVALLALPIIVLCFGVPNTIIHLFFGDAYLNMAPLLWKYALATSIFAVSNMFAYYYLSLDVYLPVIVSGIFGLLQVVLVAFFHESLAQVVHVQIIAMSILLLVQLLYFSLHYKTS